VSGENLHLNVVENIVTKPTGTFNLSANAFEIYTQLRKDNRGVQPGDDYLLKLLAVNIDYFNQITESINIGGFKMKFKTGAQQVRPEFSVYREVTENIQKIIKELGLNSLTKIKNKIDASIGPIDPLNDIL
jgi:phage terminase small subunit